MRHLHGSIASQLDSGGRRTQLTRTELSDRELAIQILDCTHLIR
jgi:hypothetical protein